MNYLQKRVEHWKNPRGLLLKKISSRSELCSSKLPSLNLILRNNMLLWKSHRQRPFVEMLGFLFMFTLTKIRIFSAIFDYGSDMKIFSFLFLLLLPMPHKNFFPTKKTLIASWYTHAHVPSIFLFHLDCFVFLLQIEWLHVVSLFPKKLFSDLIEITSLSIKSVQFQ